MKPTDILGNIKLYNADNMEVMKTFKDKQFSLAIIDPPYGIGVNQMNMGGEVRLNQQQKIGIIEFLMINTSKNCLG